MLKGYFSLLLEVDLLAERYLPMTCYCQRRTKLDEERIQTMVYADDVVILVSSFFPTTPSERKFKAPMLGEVRLKQQKLNILRCWDRYP